MLKEIPKSSNQATVIHIVTSFSGKCKYNTSQKLHHPVLVDVTYSLPGDPRDLRMQNKGAVKWELYVGASPYLHNVAP